MKLKLELKLVGRCRVTLVLFINGSHMYVWLRSPSQKIPIAFCVRAITELPYALYLPSCISVLSR